MNKREKWIDTVKGIAMFLVVLGHCGKDNLIYNGIYWIHLPLFIIVSGILFYVNKKWEGQSFTENIIHKSKQLLYPYIMFGLLLIISRYLNYIVTGFKFRLSTYLNLIARLENSTNWFLPILFFSEIIFIFIIKRINVNLSSTKGIIKVLICVFAFVGLTALFVTLKTHFINNLFLTRTFTILGRISSFSVFLLIGYLFANIFEHYKLIYINNKNILLPILTLIFVIVFYICNSGALGPCDLHFIRWNNTFIYFIASCISCCALIGIFAISKYNNAIFNTIGETSLIINGTHNSIYIKHFARRIVSENFSYIYQLSTIGPLCVAALTIVVELIIVVPILQKAFPFVTDVSKIQKLIKKISTVIVR